MDGIHRARLRRAIALGLGGPAGDRRPAHRRLRARQCVARHQRHGDQQRQRQRPDSAARVPRQGGGDRAGAAAVRHPRLPLGQLRGAAHDRGPRDGRPLDAAVAAWWRAKADEIYARIPDFGGFVVKANSEGQPGPQDYKRTHADGANMLADAVAPHGGIVMWRAFVYDDSVDRRSRQARVRWSSRRLDGTFRNNVFVQVKNGPLDFQPREPFHPLFGAMPKTPLMAELQVTQEYFGQSDARGVPRAAVAGVLRVGHVRRRAGLHGRARDRGRRASLRRYGDRRRGQHRQRPELDRAPSRAGQLACVRPARVEPVAGARGARRRVGAHDMGEDARRS